MEKKMLSTFFIFVVFPVFCGSLVGEVFFPGSKGFYDAVNFPRHQHKHSLMVMTHSAFRVECFTIKDNQISLQESWESSQHKQYENYAILFVEAMQQGCSYYRPAVVFGMTSCTVAFRYIHVNQNANTMTLNYDKNVWKEYSIPIEHQYQAQNRLIKTWTASIGQISQTKWNVLNKDRKPNKNPKSVMDVNNCGR